MNITSIAINRYTAAFSHFLISALVLAAFLAVMRLVWYPDFYFTANGGWEIIAILIGVDLVIGPSLTLIVFKPGKPGLKLDMTAIVLLQIAALLYGGSVIYKERPLYMVYYSDTFEIVTANELAQLNPGKEIVKDVDGSGRWPQLVYAELPADKTLRAQLTQEVLEGKFRPPQRPEYYQALTPHLQKVAGNAIDKQTYIDWKGLSTQEVEQLVGDASMDMIVFYTVYGKRKDPIIALDMSTGEVVGWVVPPDREKK
ncbi:hypothetical protein [Sulfuriflexus mobilis]|uniref:hypothetical protein n=1 Tax=Sulfuriflexus mobilis TaxID=1811807 RepID=UPI000F835D1B|nr:hypothetical protein [Sulfuriflexus mobilis]